MLGTEGATDPDIYRELVGMSPEEVRRGTGNAPVIKATPHQQL